MKHKKRVLSVCIAIVAALVVQAQTTSTTSSGEAFGSGGVASYTVGQVVYSTNTGTNGSVAEGVQQPFEISVETGIEQQGINLACAVYPNPVTDYLILTIDNNIVQTMHASSQLIYQLYDTNGKLIVTNKVITAETKIKTDNLKQGNYLLRIVKTMHASSQAIKTFKIVKN